MPEFDRSVTQSPIEMSPRDTEQYTRRWMEQARRLFYRNAAAGFIAGAGVVGAGGSFYSARAGHGASREAGISSFASSGAQELRSGRLRVSEGFRRQYISPERLSRGFQEIFGPSFLVNVSNVEYFDGHKPMPSSYRGSSRYEAGHCTRSPGSNNPSELVFTLDSFGHGPITNFLHVAVHEGAHSMDAENDEAMSQATRDALRNALQIIVDGDRATIFRYVNAYEGGSASNEIEDGIQREELFAELVADGLTMLPLEPDDPLLRQSVRDRMTYRLSVTHNITLEQARPYGEVLGMVADARGQTFFEDGQRAVAALGADLVEGRRPMLTEWAWQNLEDGLARSPIPSLSVALHRSLERRRSRDVDVRQAAIPRLRTYLRYFQWRAPDEPLTSRLEQADVELQAERQRYVDGIMSPVFDPGLRGLFTKMTAPRLKNAVGPLTDLQAAVFSLGAVQDERDIQTLESRIARNVAEVQNILWMAEHQSQASPQQIEAFRTAVLAWVEAEGDDRFYAEMVREHPEFLALASEARAAFENSQAFLDQAPQGSVIQVLGRTRAPRAHSRRMR